MVFPGLSGKTLVALTCESGGDRLLVLEAAHLVRGVWCEGEGARRRWGGWEAEMGRRIGRAQVSVEGSVRARSRCWGREKVEAPTFDQPTHSPPT